MIMKLKERVLLTLILSVFLLVILKLRNSKNRRDATSIDNNEDNIDVEDKQNAIQLRIDSELQHLLVKRDTNKDEIVPEVKDDLLKIPEIPKQDDITVNKKGNDIDIRDIDKLDSKKEEGKNNFHEMDPWDIWWTMVTERHVTSPDSDDAVQRILQGLATRKILSAKTLQKGTQLKAALSLDGPTQQKVVFKPKRYPRDYVINGKIYDGFDRHNAEIAAFHLDRILGFFRAPPVVGRKIDLKNEIAPVGEDALLKTFFKNKNGDDCFYGVCYYCKKSEAACAEGNIMEGSVTIWLPDEWRLAKSRHPWQRTYNKRKARWELDKDYCNDVSSVSPYSSGPRLLDIIDTSIFDFLIGNGDRHHYETFKKGGPNGMLLHLDNAKSFGNPSLDDLTILFPLSQCCKIRKSTYDRLQKIPTDQPEEELLSSRLRKSLLSDPISPVLLEPHLEALDRRLRIIMSTARRCINLHKEKNVVLDDGL